MCKTICNLKPHINTLLGKLFFPVSLIFWLSMPLQELAWIKSLPTVEIPQFEYLTGGESPQVSASGDERKLNDVCWYLGFMFHKMMNRNDRY